MCGIIHLGVGKSDKFSLYKKCLICVVKPKQKGIKIKLIQWNGKRNESEK